MKKLLFLIMFYASCFGADNVNKIPDHGINMNFMKAAEEGDMNQLQNIIDNSGLKRLDFDVYSSNYSSLGLRLAILKKHFDIIRWLLKNDVPLNESHIPLAAAIRIRDKDSIKILLEYGADPDYYCDFWEESGMML